MKINVATCQFPTDPNIRSNFFCVFEIEGVCCATLICHDNRYPGLYREYKRRGVQLMFHSYHAGHINPERFQAMQNAVGADNQKFNPGSTYPSIIQPATMHAAVRGERTRL